MPDLRRWLLLALPLICTCAYYNTFYNARQSYEEAAAMAAASPDRPGAAEGELLNSAIYGAGKVIAVYPESRWVDDAQLLIGDASLLLGSRSLTGSGRSNFEDAMLAYAAVLMISEDPDLHDRANLGMGRAAIELERNADAAAALEAVSRRDEERFYASRVLLVDALLGEERPGAALALLDTLERPSDDSLSAEVLLAEGKALLRAGLPDSAAVVCMDAGERFGRGNGYYRALVSAAQAYIEAGRPSEAVRALDRLLMGYRSDVEMARIALLNGRAKQQSGDMQGAIAVYANAAELDRSREYGCEALYRKGRMEEELGRLDDAILSYTQASGRSGEYMWTRLAADRLLDLQLLREYSDGLATATDEESWSYRLLIAEKRLDLYGSSDAGADSLLELIAEQGDSVSMARALVLMAEHTGRDEAGRRALLERALALALEGDLGASIEDRLGYPHPPEGTHRRPSYLLERGWELIEAGEYDRALEMLREGLESPWSDEVRPRLLWAAATAAEFARMESRLVEEYLLELVEEFSGTEEGGWARSRLGEAGEQDGEDGEDE